MTKSNNQNSQQGKNQPTQPAAKSPDNRQENKPNVQPQANQPAQARQQDDASAARQHQTTSTHHAADNSPEELARRNNEELQQFVQGSETPEELEAQRQAMVGKEGEAVPVRTNDPSGIPSKAAAEGRAEHRDATNLGAEYRETHVAREYVEVPDVGANQRIDHLDPQEGEHGLYRDKPNPTADGAYEPQGDRGIRDDGKTEAGRQSEAEADQNPNKAQQERQQRPS